MQRQIREVTATAMSPRREVAVTVGAQGALREISFPTSAYKRMAPQELAAVVMATLGAAHQEAAEQTANIVAPMMPAGIDAKAVLAGRAGAGDLMPTEPRMHPMIREQLDRQGELS
jgi:hypothetical protein